MTNESFPLWRFVPFHEYARPSEPTSAAAHAGLRQLWRRFRRSALPAEPVNIHAELRTAPQRLLDAVSPLPEWTDAADVLEQTLSVWADEENHETLPRILIGPPGSGTGQLVTAWAATRGWKVVEPPLRQGLLTGGAEWLSFFDDAGRQGFVIPDLEKIYLRHRSGLTLIRRFLDELWRRKARCLVGCSSWAWEYLRRAVSADSFFSPPLCLQAFGRSHLDRWFRMLACECGRSSVVFRQSSNGELLLKAGGAEQQKVPASQPEAQAGEPEHGFFARIAARSRGIPLVAWAIWRNSLLVSEDEAQVGDEAVKAAAGDRGLTIWVRNWEQISLPEIPEDVDRTGLFLLHSLLLHGGLSADLLCETLCLTHAESERSIVRLQSAGLIKFEENVWRVTLSGYPAVRSHLQNEDYLVDAF